MDKLLKKIIYTLIGMLYGVLASFPAVAEDIQIYTTVVSSSIETQGNLLFVLDTSSSMNRMVTEREPYDPTHDYSGGNDCSDRYFDKNQVYVLRHDTRSFLRVEGGRTNAERICDDSTSLVHRVREFNRSAITCAGANASLDNTGFFVGRFAQYRNNNWGDLDEQDLNAFLECESDGGVHGQATGNAAMWANDNSPSAWSSSSDDEINWDSVGESRTIFTGNYLNYLINAPSTQRTRLAIMKEAMNNVVASVSGINVGLMRFSGNSPGDNTNNGGRGGMVILPVADIGPIPDPAVGIIPGSHRYKFHQEVDNMLYARGTPLSEAFYEAVMYFQGGAVDYGLDSTVRDVFSPSVPESRSGNTYISPITNECQKNHIVILTDGDPSSDRLNATRRARIGSDVTGCGDHSNNCLDEIARSIGLNDQSPLDGKQVISTSTIGFFNQNDLLSDTAHASKAATEVGERFFADSAISLTESLMRSIGNVSVTGTSFSAPGVSVNAFNRSTHLNEMYFTLFEPSMSSRWAGNLKKFELKFKVDENDPSIKIPFIAGKDDKPAINQDTGFFNEESRSLWSAVADGAKVTDGGAAHQFKNLAPRNVYTFTGEYTEINGVFKPAANDSLNITRNRVNSSNTYITEDMLELGLDPPDEIPGTPRRDTLLNWAAGFDVFGAFGNNGTADMRPDMGSLLHSQPALVQYGTEANPDMVVFVATNDGYLHAFDADNGHELFSFIPQELLENLDELMVDGNHTDDDNDKIYGLDGDVVAWVNDINKDGIINGDDRAYLYVGMRRGGEYIYSIDVTNRNDPKLRWVIKGGEGDYEELADTWSTVTIGKIRNGSRGSNGENEKTVLIFGGGYDDDWDEHRETIDGVDSDGAAVFIADADTGELLWSAGNFVGAATQIDEMNYSIPARITVLDMRGDGLIDRLYVADMGGQIFRFDINNNEGLLANSVTGGRIAKLSGDGAENARRFYYPPDVALIAERGESAYLAIGIASGFRANPLNTTIHDRIYLIKDTYVYDTPASFETIREGDLTDVTLNLAGGDGDSLSQEDKVAVLEDIANAKGWYIRLVEGVDNWIGEKGLSEVLFLDGTMIVTTYVPPNEAAGTDICGVGSSGSGKVYFLDVLDGTPAFRTNYDVRADRHGPGDGLQKEGIPPPPVLMITEDGVAGMIGQEFFDVDAIQGVRKTFWHEVER